MEIRIVAQGKNEPPQLEPIRGDLLDFTNVEKMTFCVIEAGMASGEPSVIMGIVDHDKVWARPLTVYTQTSLDKFLTAAAGMEALAKTRFNWVRPEGSVTLMPMEPEMRKQMLEAIKKELEEYE